VINYGNDGDVLGEADSVTKQPNYNPRKYKGYSRFEFFYDDLQATEFGILLPSDFDQHDGTFTGYLTNQMSDGGGTQTLECFLK
jgi:hypothetical protein